MRIENEKDDNPFWRESVDMTCTSKKIGGEDVEKTYYKRATHVKIKKIQYNTKTQNKKSTFSIKMCFGATEQPYHFPLLLSFLKL